MSIGKSGIKNLAFVQDSNDSSIKPSYGGDSTCEDHVSANSKVVPLELKPDESSSPLFRGKELTAKGYILIIALAGTIFAGRIATI